MVAIKVSIERGAPMRDDISVLVGTVGAGIWRSTDGGGKWARPKGARAKMPWSELVVFALTRHPKDPNVVFAGTHEGIYRSDDRGGQL